MDDKNKTLSNQIKNELVGSDREVIEAFLSHFESDIKQFMQSMTEAYCLWKEFDSKIGNSVEKAHISSLVFGAIKFHIMSMRLMITGYQVPAGNLQRQVLETIAMAFLASKPKLGYLKRYMENKYSTHNAVRDVLNNHEALGLNKDALMTLKKTQTFYHKFSHPTMLTVASSISMSQAGGLYLGASFDEGKIEIYKKEVNNRISIAKLFENIIFGISQNLQGQ